MAGSWVFDYSDYCGVSGIYFRLAPSSDWRVGRESLHSLNSTSVLRLHVSALLVTFRTFAAPHSDATVHTSQSFSSAILASCSFLDPRPFILGCGFSCNTNTVVTAVDIAATLGLNGAYSKVLTKLAPLKAINLCTLLLEVRLKVASLSR